MLHIRYFTEVNKCPLKIYQNLCKLTIIQGCQYFSRLTNIVRNVLELWFISNKLFFGRNVDAHVAGEPNRRRRYTDVDLLIDLQARDELDQ